MTLEEDLIVHNHPTYETRMVECLARQAPALQNACFLISSLWLNLTKSFFAEMMGKRIWCGFTSDSEL
ncbi:hypothetical protein ACVJBD_007338 [Rhizobium mongolense]